MKPKTMREALEHIIRRLQMDIDDGSRPDHWSMQDLVRVANDALALQPSASAEPVPMPINQMCKILDKHLIKADEYTDCAIVYKVTFDQLRNLYDAGRASPVTAAREQEASATGAEPAAWQERQQTDYFDGWTSWYDTNSTKVVGKTEAFEVKSSGVRYQFRPLFTYRHLREYAAIARQQGRNEMLEWTVEKAAKMVEQMTMRQRLMRAAGDAKPVQPCEIAAAIRSIGTPKSAEGEGA